MPKLIDQGENKILNILFGATAVDATLYLGLYLDTDEPAENDTLSSISEVAGGTGYARIALTRGTWNIVGDLADYAQQTFTASGGDWGDVYGYFICDVASGTSGNLFFVEQFTSAPFNVTEGSTVKITPRIRAA